MLKIRRHTTGTAYARFFVIALFLLFLAIGLSIVNDYGCGPDEGIERQTSLVNFRYMIDRLNLPVPDRWHSFLAYLPELKSYRDRYYGTALHQPLVLIEALTNFSFENPQFYRLRHLFTFLNWYAAAIVFYRVLRRRFSNRAVALIGCGFLILSPRFFAESFYNNKDILFTAWTIFTLAALARWLENPTTKRTLIAAFILALTVNTRLNGIAYLPIAVLIGFIAPLRAHKPVRPFIIHSVALIALFMIFLILVTPNLWETPLTTLAETFQFSSNHPNHDAANNLFKGQHIDASQSKTYLVTWIALTTPTAILILSLIGVVVILVRTLNAIRDRSLSNKIKESSVTQGRTDYLWLLSAWLPFAAIVLLKVTVYNTWRHCYFVYPTIAYCATLTVDAFLLRCETLPTVRLRRIGTTVIYVLSVAILTVNAVWIARNHPFQFAYFAPWARENAENFSGDYWGIATKQMLETIVTRDTSPWIHVHHAFTQTGSINRGNLPEQDRFRLDLSYEITPETDYIVFSRDEKTVAEIDFPGFTPWNEIRVDGNLIGMVLKKEE